MINLQEKVLAIDLIFLSAIKKRGDFSLPPSPHEIRINDSLQFYEHFLVESFLNKFFDRTHQSCQFSLMFYQ